MPNAADSTAWSLTRGATVLPDRSVHFEVWAPDAQRVDLHLPARGATALIRMDGPSDGVFQITVPDVAPGDDYTYRLDRGPDRPDPVSRSRPAGVHGPTRIIDPGAFDWHDDEWGGLAMADCVVYELHVGTFTDQGTFDAIVPRLPYLHDLGVTAIELMPVAEFPGGRNWGYDGVSLYAPDGSYGGPGGLKQLIDAAHATGIAVILDVVYNHLGAEGNYLGDFGPYFTDRYRTPWGTALNYDGPGSDEVRRYMVDNARYWITEYHLDGLRLDAVHQIFDLSATHLLQEITDAVHAVGERLGRHTLVIAESDLNDPRLVRPVEQGGFGLDAQWSDDFHHAVHAELTGERNGYYADFNGLEDVADALANRFVYRGKTSAYRRRRHGAPAADIPADRFVVSVQNHDQIGNRAAGERLSVLLSLDQQKLAAALLLLSPYVPLIFMGQEYGETNPFLYFISHQDEALVDAVRQGRWDEFAAFGWTGEVPDPAAVETFDRSRLDRLTATAPGHAGLLALYTDLLALRRAEPALRPGGARVSVTYDASAGWISLRLTPPKAAELLTLFNFDRQHAEARVPLSEPGAWHLVLATDDTRYEGQGTFAYDGAVVALPGAGAVLFRG